MDRGNAASSPSARDRQLRRVRHAGRVLAVAAAGATAVFSVVAAHAFRGHNGKARVRVAAPPVAAPHRSRVPPPPDVPQIAGAPPPLQAPEQPPAAAAPPESAPPPETSGGS